MQKYRKLPSFDVMGLLTQHNTRWTLSNYQENQIVYTQGDPADSVFYIHRGKVKVAVVSKLGKESHRRNPGTGRILRRGSADRQTAAVGYNHHDVDMRDRAAGEGDCSPASASGPQSLPTIFLPIFWLEPPELKQTWSTSCSIPARCGWHVLSCCWQIMTTTLVWNRYL